MRTQIKVVCGIIQKEDTYFIAKRNLEKHLGGYWEFPGGKIEKDESPQSALERELLEELGMKVEGIQIFGSHIHAYEHLTIELIAYSCCFKEATFRMTDHIDYAFIKVQDFDKYKMAPADKFFINILLSL